MMSDITLIKRIALMVAIIVGAILLFAGGLMLLNVRAYWGVVLGGLICLGTPIVAGVKLRSMMKESNVQ